MTDATRRAITALPFALLATGAAAAHQQMIAQEEEEMTPYTQSDLEEDWEFKILRSIWGSFGNPQFFQDHW